MASAIPEWGGEIVLDARTCKPGSNPHRCAAVPGGPARHRDRGGRRRASRCGRPRRVARRCHARLRMVHLCPGLPGPRGVAGGVTGTCPLQAARAAGRTSCTTALRGPGHPTCRVGKKWGSARLKAMLKMIARSTTRSSPMPDETTQTRPAALWPVPRAATGPKRFIEMINAERSPTFYRFDSLEQLKVWREMEERGEEPVVMYRLPHLHRGVPSRTGISYASEPNAHYVLVSTRDPGHRRVPLLPDRRRGRRRGANGVID